MGGVRLVTWESGDVIGERKERTRQKEATPAINLVQFPKFFFFRHAPSSDFFLNIISFRTLNKEQSEEVETVVAINQANQERY
jgi:hypothetical protein